MHECQHNPIYAEQKFHRAADSVRRPHYDRPSESNCKLRHPRREREVLVHFQNRDSSLDPRPDSLSREYLPVLVITEQHNSIRHQCKLDLVYGTLYGTDGRDKSVSFWLRALGTVVKIC